MKNLISFVDPKKSFNFDHQKHHEDMVKIQIDNSLDLGWKPEDIILATNFPYEYQGVKTLIVSDNCYYSKNNFYRSSKIPIIMELFNRDLIGDELWWFHDNDAYQLEKFDEIKIKEELGDKIIGITGHGWTAKWNAGSFFFDKRAKELFPMIKNCMDEKNLDEQDALNYLIVNNIFQDYKTFNITYNFTVYKHPLTLPIADKPLMVAHFNPYKEKHITRYINLIPERFKLILKKYESI
jgi:hypothetical protein